MLNTFSIFSSDLYSVVVVAAEAGAVVLFSQFSKFSFVAKATHNALSPH